MIIFSFLSLSLSNDQSDRIILNKCDLVSPEAADQVCAELEAINGVNSVIRSVQSEVDLQLLLNVRAFDAERTAERFHARQAGTAGGGKGHTSDIRTSRITIVGLLDKQKVRTFLAGLLWEGDGSYDVLRLKGLLSCHGKKVRYALQGVRDVWSLDKTTEPPGNTSDFVFIGRNMRLAEWEKELQMCVHS